MIRLFALLLMAVVLCCCHESVERHAAREAQEYTRRHCPTPVVNYSRTDSVLFDATHRVFVYYCTFVDVYDDAAKVEANKTRITQSLHNEIAARTTMKRYVDADMGFVYIVRSAQQPSLILYCDTIRIEH